jgi:hypothetical protein
MKTKRIVLIVLSIFMIISSTVAIGSTVNKEKNNQTLINDDSEYAGTLRVYIVEPTSRWNNYDGEPYHFGFLDFAVDEKLSIEYLDSYSKQVTWNAQDSDIDNINQNNIMAIAAVFNPQAYEAYANPPRSNPFDAYYVDAAAAATPGNTGYNTKNEEFTHTVFCEEVTSTRCPYCPSAAEGLDSVYKSGNYPFYYVALVVDKNDIANNRAIDGFNIYGYPSCFFDGGYKVVIGSSSENTYTNRVASSATRHVHDLDLNISVEWISKGVLNILVNIKNNEESPNYAPTQPEITGPSRGRLNKEYNFNFVSSDLEGGDLYYWIDWGDGENTGWIGPYKSGEEISVSHSWTEQETFIIKAKSKDIEGAESEEATTSFSAPRNRLIISFLLERLDFLKNLFKY